MVGSASLSDEAQALYDWAPCGLARTTPDGTFLLVNRTFCGWVGLTGEQLVGRRKFQELLTIGSRIFHQTHWSPLLSMQGSISEVRLELAVAGGGTVPVVVNALARTSEGAKVHELAAYVARDRDKYERELVSARKRLEEALAESARLRDEANDRALFAEQMIGIVSHDLRNPIATVQTGAALLARAADPRSHERVVASIFRASQRANRLISELLDFTQARLGDGIAVKVEPIALHDLVADALGELALAYPGRQLQHVTVGSGECRADDARLEQLLGNLVSNAMTYGETNCAVTVTSWIEPERFGISVHNFGPPIAPELLRDIFQPMTRGAGGRGAPRSVGLGLFIVNEIARAHGGQTRVESTAEGGTLFDVVLGRGPAGPSVS